MQQISYRASDTALPLIVVAMLALMILPLPVVILDSLLMLNIAFSISLIITAVYLTSPERFTALPSILLLSTVFRLSLNIATTRQLLMHGVAPKIVTAFGQFVVSGNLVVGLTIFSIITLVQFIVIAKGAERIAEVAARFTLDALPGKQMAIDADVRSGFVSLAEARSRRLDLQREAKLFGALDGAMKFVKGDAIAGIFMIAVNICAGFIVGVTQHKLSLTEAALRYTIFTIGDGLVAQIPALLVATAAGISVTRVAEREGSLLGRDLVSQLVCHPQAVGTTATILFALAFIPGLPTIQFLIAGVILFITCRKVIVRQRQDLQSQLSEFEPRVEPGIKLVIGSRRLHLSEKRELSRRLQKIRERMFSIFGLVLPEIIVEEEDGAGASEFRLYSRGGLIVQRIMKRSAEADPQYLTTLDEELSEALSRNAADLVDDTQTRILLEVFEPLCEDLINSIVPAKFTVTELTRILRRLLVEGISVRELPRILQTLAECSPGCEDTHFSRDDYLLAEVRVGLRRTISENIKDATGICRVWRLSHELDATLSGAALRGLSCDPVLAGRIAHAIESTRAEINCRTVIVASRFSRSILVRALENVIENVSIVSGEELIHDLKIVVAGEIELSSVPNPVVKSRSSEVRAEA